MSLSNYYDRTRSDHRYSVRKPLCQTGWSVLKGPAHCPRSKSPAPNPEVNLEASHNPGDYIQLSGLAVLPVAEVWRVLVGALETVGSFRSCVAGPPISPGKYCALASERNRPSDPSALLLTYSILMPGRMARLFLWKAPTTDQLMDPLRDPITDPRIAGLKKILHPTSRRSSRPLRRSGPCSGLIGQS